jgi:hypothetical protein
MVRYPRLRRFFDTFAALVILIADFCRALMQPAWDYTRFAFAFGSPVAFAAPAPLKPVYRESYATNGLSLERRST